jgi:hypothetical protein
MDQGLTGFQQDSRNLPSRVRRSKIVDETPLDSSFVRDFSVTLRSNHLQKYLQYQMVSMVMGQKPTREADQWLVRSGCWDWAFLPEKPRMGLEMAFLAIEEKFITSLIGT